MRTPPDSDQARLEGLRGELNSLAQRLGRPPTLLELRGFLRRHRLTAEDIEALTAPAPMPGGDDALLPQPRRAAGRSRVAVATDLSGTGTATSAWPVLDPVAVPDIASGRGDQPDLGDDALIAPARTMGRQDPGPRRAAQASREGTATDPSGSETAAWHDSDDPFAVPDIAPGGGEDAPDLGDDPLVARLVRDVRDDWSRTNGQVGRDDVTRLGIRRGLDPEQLANVFDELVLLGIDWSGTSHPDERNLDDASAPTERTRGVVRDQLSAYFARAGRIRLLTADDEVRLGTAIRAGREAAALLEDSAKSRRLAVTQRRQLEELREAGDSALSDLVQANLRLVISIARLGRYHSCGVDFADRIQDGNLGLIRAAEKFDATLGYKFSTYATWWIRQSIDRGIADRGRLIRIPVHAHERVVKLRRVRSRLLNRIDREPTLQELAECMGEDPGTVAALLQHLQPIVSVDAIVGTDGDLTLGDLLAEEADIDGRLDPAQVVLTAGRRRDLEDVLLAVLNEREEFAIKRRYGLDDGDDQTLDVVGRELGVTRERARQILNKAMSKLRAAPQTRPLYAHLLDLTTLDNPLPPPQPAAETAATSQRAKGGARRVATA